VKPTSGLRAGLVALARTTFDVRLAESVHSQLAQSLTEARLTVVGPAELVVNDQGVEAACRELEREPLDLLLVLQATFADSRMVIELARQVHAPLLLWAVPEEPSGGRLRLNSFCGINLAAHALRRAGHRYLTIYARPGDWRGVERARQVARAGQVRRLLAGARIGRVGGNPDGFDPCSMDPAALQRRFGVRIVQLALEEVFDRARAALPDASGLRQMLDLRLAGLAELDQPALGRTLGSYLALRQLAAEMDLDGLAVRCWPEFFTELGCAACGAMSLLTDELTPCSCEADVNGTITQLVLQWLSGEPAFGTDMVAFDADRNHAVLWHCGLAPLSMADPKSTPRGTIHSNRRLPLLLEFPLRPGRVTIARLSEAEGTGSYRLVVGGGEMLEAPLSFSGTSGVVRFDRPAGLVMETILAEGLDHHVALTYGDHQTALEILAEMLDIPVLRL